MRLGYLATEIGGVIGLKCPTPEGVSRNGHRAPSNPSFLGRLRGSWIGPTLAFPLHYRALV